MTLIEGVTLMTRGHVASLSPSTPWKFPSLAVKISLRINVPSKGHKTSPLLHD
jgi:hypothetical protein